MSCTITGAGLVVTFSYSSWQARYPEFNATVSQQAAQLCFNEAELYLNNSTWSRVLDGSVGGQRSMLLNMVTAHIAKLYFGSSLGPASDAVGRLSDAAEGSVSVSLQYVNDMTAAEAWFAQTKYGASFWNATTIYRSAQYVSLAPGYRVPGGAAPFGGCPAIFYPGQGGPSGAWGWPYRGW